MRPQTWANIFICLLDQAYEAPICTYQNGTPKVARNVFIFGEVWNTEGCHGNGAAALILWSTFRRILLQRIKLFWYKLAEISFFFIFLHICSSYHCNLLLYLSEEIERIQLRALRIIFPDCSYSEGLAKAGLATLYDRRSALCKDFFSEIDTQRNNKLSHLPPAHSQHNYNLRSTRAFAAPVCKTNRFRDSFIISYCIKCIF